MIIDSLIALGNTLITRLFPDPIARQQAQLELLKLEENGELARISEQAKIITAEASSDSWLASNWRPLTMVSFVFIIVNNYILVQYAHFFGINIPILDLPPNMWHLLELGLGGYVIGRSAEKVATNLKGLVNITKNKE
jgi:hypothetical protein